MPKLTKRNVEAAVVPATKPVYLWDSQLPGFGIKILPSGTRRYIVKYRVGSGRRAPQRWMTLGTHGAITCDQARNLARSALSQITEGLDPQAEKIAAREEPTVLDLWTRFSDDYLCDRKPQTVRQYQYLWRNSLSSAFGSSHVVDVSRSDIERLHRRLQSTPYTANRALALLSIIFNMAERWGLREQGTNPCKHVLKYKEHARERYLTADEIGALGEALEEMVSSDELWVEAAGAIRLLLLTGARLNEILTIERDWIDLERRVVVLPDSKTGKKLLYLSEPAAEVIIGLLELTRDPDSKFLLPGRHKGRPFNNLSKPWKRICERLGLEDVRLHDLRHTAASVAVGRGASLPVIGKLLGHRQAQTTMRYAHVDLDPALAVANEIGNAIGGALRIPPSR